MTHNTPLVSSRQDWARLSIQSAKAGVARALIGYMHGPRRPRYLVAEVLPESSSLQDALARCEREGMGLLEAYPTLSPNAISADLTGLVLTQLKYPLLFAATSTPAVWQWDISRNIATVLAGPRLIGGDTLDDQSMLPDLSHCDQYSPSLAPRLVRQTAALGTAGQQRLSNLTVAVVGCGRTGSLLAQLLALAGVGRLLLIDNDRIEQSNRNGLLIATTADAQAGTRKVTALRRHLKRLTPDVAAIAFPHTLYDQRSRAAVLTSDVLVGCTDNEGSRLHMNALATQYLLPYVDCGVGLERHADRLIGGGQVRTVLPGGPCLECYGGINRWKAALDLAAPHDRALGQAHGYGLGSQEPAPALAFLNAVIAAEAVATVVALVTDLRPVAPFLAYDLVHAHLEPRRDIRRNPACVVCASGRRYGRGESLPLPMPEETDLLPLPALPLVSHHLR